MMSEMGIVEKYSLLRWSGTASDHCSDGSNQTHAEYEPWVRGHQSVRPSIGMKSASSNGDYSKAKTGVHKGIVEVFAFKQWHAAIFASLPIEDEVDRDQSSTEDGTTVDEALGQVSLRYRVVVGVLALVPAESLLEGVTRGSESAGVFQWRELFEDRLLRDFVVEAPDHGSGS